MTAKRLSGLDAAFLALERPGRYLHGMGLIVLDPSTVPGGFSLDAWREQVVQRLSLVPVLRRRLVEVPLGLHRPVRVEGADLDFEYHVRTIAVRPPVGPEELTELVAAIDERPLDRRRPLWELHLVEGLEDGRVAVIGKLHHALMDGLAGMQSMASLFSLGPDAEPSTGAAPIVSDRAPGTVELLAGAAGGMMQQPVKLAQALGATSRRVLGSTARSSLGMAGRARDEHGGMVSPFTAPRTVFNRALSERRIMAYTSLPFDDVAAIRRTLDVTFNDVVLAVVAGALRGYLAARGELPDRPLVAAVPIALREGRGEDPSNAVSLLLVELGTDLADPVARLASIHAAADRAKGRYGPQGGQATSQWLEAFSPLVLSTVAQVYAGLRIANYFPPVCNVLVSDVPGPPVPLYLAGARLVALHPLGPIYDGMGLNVTVVTSADSVDFGLVACREQTPDLWDLATGLHDALAELAQAAGVSKGSVAPSRAGRA